MVDWLGAAGAGIIGALAMSLMTDIGRISGMIDANLTRYQGCILTGRCEGIAPWVVGLGMHLSIGAALAIGYALAFWLLGGHAGWLSGLMIGAVHGSAAGAGFPMLDALNPCVRDGRIRGFGLFGREYGGMMVMGLFAGHLAFGAIVGWLYTVPNP